MAIIGAFERSEEGYVGEIQTMTINTEAKFIVNNKNGNERAPDFKVVVENLEIGAAWKATSKGDEERDFLRVELVDPSFAQPIRAALFFNDKGACASLKWHR